MSSCSLFTSLSKRPTVDDKVAGEKMNQDVSMVPRDDYNKLLDKYQALIKRNRQLESSDGPKDLGPAVHEIPMPQDIQSSSLTEKNTQVKSAQYEEAVDLVDQLEVTKTPEPETALAETVDVFASPSAPKDPKTGPKELINPIDKSAIIIDPITSSMGVEDQIQELQKATDLVQKNMLDKALMILKALENSDNIQIKVRSKFWIGEILFKQGEYDLSMQIFEEIVSHYAFSGIVIKTLGRLIVCSDKLKLKKKYDLYYSILHDFFEGEA